MLHTDRPIIISHPSSQLVTTDISIDLTCEVIGSGVISYQWESSNVNESQWMIINHSNSEILVVKNLQQSRQFRCVVYNEAGETISRIATLTVLSK